MTSSIDPIFVEDKYLPDLELVQRRMGMAASQIFGDPMTLIPLSYVDGVAICADYTCLDTDDLYRSSFELELIMAWMGSSKEAPATGADVIMGYRETLNSTRGQVKRLGEALSYLLRNSSYDRRDRREIHQLVNCDNVECAQQLLEHMREDAKTLGRARPAGDAAYDVDNANCFDPLVTIMTWAYIMTSVNRGDWEHEVELHEAFCGNYYHELFLEGEFLGEFLEDEEAEYAPEVYKVADYIAWASRIVGVLRNVMHRIVSGMKRRDEELRMMRRIKSARSAAGRT